MNVGLQTRVAAVLLGLSMLYNISDLSVLSFDISHMLSLAVLLCYVKLFTQVLLEIFYFPLGLR